MDWVVLFAFISPLVSVGTALLTFPELVKFIASHYQLLIGLLFFFARAEATAFEWYDRR